MHHLFLIEDDAVRFFEDFFQLREFVADSGLALLAVDEIIDHATLNRAGAIERVEGGEILDTGRLVAAKDIAHAVRFKLKDGGGFSASEEFVGFGVVQSQIVDVNFRAAVLLNHLDGVVQHGERCQTEKIHFQQADALERIHVVLGGDFIAV